MTDYADLLPIAHQAVDVAHEIMTKMQPGVLTAKGERDMASEVDYTIEEQVRAYLSWQTPDVGFLGEEHGRSGATNGAMWALDPVDGTVNFIHGSPLCAISLGLIVDGRPRLGVIDLPFLDERYSAVEGRGAELNGSRISVSSISEVSEAVVAIGDYAVGEGAAQKNRERFPMTERLARTVQRIRMHGSAAIDLAWLAAGRVDAIAMLTNKPWDTAAGVIIASEAGAQVVDRDGLPHDTEAESTVAAPPALISKILALISGTYVA